MKMTKIKVFTLLLALSFLYACSARFIYNHLDWALEWYIDDLVTLNEDQEWRVRGAVNSLLAWHRVNQLPFYISSLDEAQTAVNSEITLSFLKRFYYGHEKAWMNLKYQLTPTLAGLLKTLSDSQVNQLENNLKSQEKDVTEDFIDKTPEQLVEGRTERMIGRLEYWIGDLNKQQQQIVVNWSHTVKPQTNDWINSRKQWQTNFVKIIRESRQKSQFNELMVEHFQNSRKYWPDGYEKSYYYNVEHTLQMISDIGKHLSKKQKEKLIDRITGLKEHLTEIHQDQSR